MRFQELLEERGFTGYSLAKKSGVAQQAINRLQSGQREFSKMRVESAMKIAVALDMSIEEIKKKLKEKCSFR